MDERDIEQAIEALKDGGTAIYPTETCYGLGCDALDEDAIEQVYEIKQRPREKYLTVIVDSLTMAERYCHLTDVERAVCEALMPGPLTVIAEKRSSIPGILNEQFVFRVPDHDVSRRLSRGIDGPLVATSANMSGAPSSYRIDNIDPSIRSSVDAIIDGGELDRRPSSTIIDLEGGTPTVHRRGPVSKDAIQAVIED